MTFSGVEEVEDGEEAKPGDPGRMLSHIDMHCSAARRRTGTSAGDKPPPCTAQTRRRALWRGRSHRPGGVKLDQAEQVNEATIQARRRDYVVPAQQKPSVETTASIHLPR